jgi:hypothetical protein
MKPFLVAIMILLSSSLFGQDKYSYAHYIKLIKLKGTYFVIPTIENWGKMMAANSK